MNWRLAVKRSIPPRVLNHIFLAFPAFYSNPIVRYESGLQEHGGLDDLLSQLRPAMTYPGDIIECGSSRCGTSVIMARAVRDAGVDKTVYAYDSFEGFDRGELRQERESGLTAAVDSDFTSTSYDYVREKLRRLRLDGRVVPVKGYFRDTLPAVDRRFCFALVDCDLGESVGYCARTIWPRLVPGGRLVFDDYLCDGFKGVRPAVDRFVTGRGDEIDDHGLLERLYFVRKRPDGA